jgi:phosphohistidine swiveling domain-containing protein
MTAAILKLHLVTALVAIITIGCSSLPKAGDAISNKSVQEKVVLQHANGQDRHWLMKSGGIIREEHCLSSHGDLHMVLQYSTEV